METFKNIFLTKECLNFKNQIFNMTESNKKELKTD
jgi:hypothetical protein